MLIVFPHPLVCFLVTVELLPVYKLHWHQGIIIMMMLPEQTWCTAFVTAFVVEVRLSPSLSLFLSLSPSLFFPLSHYVSHFTGICRAPLQVTLAHQELKKPQQMTDVVHYTCRWSLSEAFSLSLHL